MDAQIKKGILEMCILHIIFINEEIYGYDIIKKMKTYFPEVNESTFYSILRRLYKNNATNITFKDISSNGPPRKYYRLTESGKTLLETTKSEWSYLVNIVKEIGIT